MVDGDKVAKTTLHDEIWGHAAGTKPALNPRRVGGREVGEGWWAGIVV